MKTNPSFSIEEKITNTPIAKKVKATTKNFEITPTSPNIKDHIQGKKHIHLSAKRGEIMNLCASLDNEYICCAVHVLHVVSNCPYNCTYCFLQNYLTNNTLSVVADTKAIIKEIKQKIKAQPWRLFRIGTWELGDSLALEPHTNQSQELAQSFATLPNALLDLRTKSDLVDNLLPLDHKQKTIVSWTLNTKTIINKEELKTANLTQRLAAMKKTTDAGYLTSIHFDPMILYDNWEADYSDLVKELFQKIPSNKIAWISIGSLRFNPEMKKLLEQNYPSSKLTAQEMIAGTDNKMRYAKPLRLKMYQHLLKEIKKYQGSEEILIHLCMERWDVWKKLFGTYPKSIAELDYNFANSLHQRFPQIVPQTPNLKKYLENTY